MVHEKSGEPVTTSAMPRLVTVRVKPYSPWLREGSTPRRMGCGRREYL